jgi:replicative DNA helicase
MGVLGSMVLDKDCINEVVQILRGEFFYRQDHCLIYDALLSLSDRSEPVDLILLRDELKRRGQFEQVGGIEYLMSLPDSVPSPANAIHYAKIVRDKAMLRNLITVAGQINNLAYDGTGAVAEIMEEAEQKIFEVTQEKISGQAEVMRSIIHSVFESIDQRDGSVVTGVPTGFLELDDLTGGLQRGEMIVIAARPSMGKTALALNIAEHVGADNIGEDGKGLGVAVFSLEMASQQLAERMLCGRGHVDSHQLRRGTISDDDHVKLHHAAGELEQSPIFVDDSPGLTPLELRGKARRLKLQHDIQLVVVDYLQLMYVPGAESRQMEVSTISRHIKALARELNIPVIVMSQLNRGPEGREDHRPRMSDLRESGAIEQDADVVMMLHREDYYHKEPDYDPTNTAELIIAKQRNGPTGTVNLSWQGAYTRFENLSHMPEPMDF